MLVAWSVRAFALDPALDVDQYAHSSWKYADGFSLEIITSIAQTKDGYLWFGTGAGLVRFDGVRSVQWQPPPGQSLPGTYIRSLLAARDGTLWIGTHEGLARWKDGRLTVLHREDRRDVGALAEDGEGTVWAGVLRSGEGARLCEVRGESLQCQGDDASFGRYIAALHVDRRGALWVAATKGLWRWKPGAPKLYVLPSEPLLGGTAEDASGAMLVVTMTGVFRVAEGDAEPRLVVAHEGTSWPHRILVDREGSLWIGTAENGLLRKAGGQVQGFNAANGLSADSIYRLFEDREGSIWVATQNGVDRFRENAIPTFSVKQGLSSTILAAVLATRDRSLWIATRVGLDRWRNGVKSTFRTGQSPGSLLEDSRGRLWVATQHGTGYLENERFVAAAGIPDGYIDAMSEDRSGNIWIAHRSAGLLRISPDREVVALPWEKLGRKDPATRVIADANRGGLWVGFLFGGVSYLEGSDVKERYTSAEGLAAGQVADLRLDREGAVWVAAAGGLSRVRNGRVATLNARNGLPCDSVFWSIEDDADSTWLRTKCGILGIPKAELAGWAAAVDRGTEASPRFHGTLLANTDGARSSEMVSSFSPLVTKAGDGKLWFVAVNGLAAVDPRRLRHNPLPPPVAIEEVIADRVSYPRAGLPIHLPPLVRDLQIDYTALSLVAPEKVRFRYKLEGRDRDWQDAGTRRQAFYTDLDPGKYRFRVIAANNSGVWNEEGASLDFSVAPAYWQTLGFRAACVAALLLVLWALYRLRLRQVARTRDAQRKLAQASKIATVAEAAASIAHEIHQPLQAVATSGDACVRWLDANPPNIERARRAAERVVGDANAAAEVVNRIRALFRHAPPAKTELDINKLILQVCALMADEIQAHVISLETELAHDVPKLEADAVQLQQVVVNLVRNAIDALAASELPRSLAIRSRRDGESVVVDVRDHGPGIAHPERIFEPFATTKEAGMGMGLAICRTIIEAHGGRIGFTPNEVRGVTFSFSLPVAP